MAATARGASLDPSTHTKGGAVPDGDYTIKSVSCEVWDYNGKGPEGPAIAVVYADPKDPATTYTQYYSAGKAEFLMPSEDKRRMVHPQGEDAKYAGGSNASVWLSSLLKAGFPTERMAGDDVTVFAGATVQVTTVAQQKRGMTDEKEGKTIPLVTKIMSLPGVKAGTARPTVVKPTAAATAPATATPAASSTANGDADLVAVEAVMKALDTAPDHTLKVKGLAVRCLKFAPGTKLNDLTKLITAEWLIAQADTTGWTTDGEVVAL